jgi:hypothetical protein
MVKMYNIKNVSKVVEKQNGECDSIYFSTTLDTFFILYIYFSTTLDIFFILYIFTTF